MPLPARREIVVLCDLLLERSGEIDEELFKVNDKKADLERTNEELLFELRDLRIEAKHKRMEVKHVFEDDRG